MGSGCCRDVAEAVSLVSRAGIAVAKRPAARSPWRRARTGPAGLPAGEGAVAGASAAAGQAGAPGKPRGEGEAAPAGAREPGAERSPEFRHVTNRWGSGIRHVTNLGARRPPPRRPPPPRAASSPRTPVGGSSGGSSPCSGRCRSAGSPRRTTRRASRRRRSVGCRSCRQPRTGTVTAVGLDHERRAVGAREDPGRPDPAPTGLPQRAPLDIGRAGRGLAALRTGDGRTRHGDDRTRRVLWRGT